MAVSAVNPNLTRASMGRRSFDMLDGLLVLRDINDGAESATAAEASVPLAVEAPGTYCCVIHHNAIGGTVDGSNGWTLAIQVSDDDTNWVTVRSLTLKAAADRYDVVLSGVEIEQLIDAAGETGKGAYIRITATEAGTTAGDLTYGAHLTKSI